MTITTHDNTPIKLENKNYEELGYELRVFKQRRFERFCK